MRARAINVAGHGRHALGPSLWALCPAGAGRVGGCSGVRWIHQGHLQITLDKYYQPRHRHLKEVDQAPPLSSVRREKDQYLREMGRIRGDLPDHELYDTIAKQERISKLFEGPDAQGARDSVTETTEQEMRAAADSIKSREGVNEAFRMYRLLRPEAPPFYEEDAMLGMSAKMNKLLKEESDVVAEANAYYDPFRSHLPVVNQKAFLIALGSVVDSLADDLQTICDLLGLEAEVPPGDPLRFMKLVDLLFEAFPLKKDPSHVDNFMNEHWDRLKTVLPKAIVDLGQETVAGWLKDHLYRVRENQQRHKPKILLHQRRGFFEDGPYYSLAEDFPYDSDPMPGELADERNLDFPLESAEEFLTALLGMLSNSQVGEEVAASFQKASKDHLTQNDTRPGTEGDVAAVATQFQQFVWDLEKVGLRNWLRMDIRELERKLPRGDLEKLEYDSDDLKVARLMLRCAARGKANLLDFEAVDPHKLLHGTPTLGTGEWIDEELKRLPCNLPVSDEALGWLVDNYQGKDTKYEPEKDKHFDGAMVADIYQKEMSFYRSGGPAEWFQVPDGQGGHSWDWRWRQPHNAFFDHQRGIYVRLQRGVNPTLDLSQLRQHMLEMRRMAGMVKDGRIYFYRCIVAVGNGRGVYGFGIGFGNQPKEARADAALKALQRLDYIDMDEGRMMCTPVRGMEYKATYMVIPRPIGKGLVCNKKFLPLNYILGLDNCRVRFFQQSVWATRIRAVKRALDAIVSRRTLANMTGKRYALLIAPGDHWVHWPDRWFDTTKAKYDDIYYRARAIRRHTLCFKKRGNKIVSYREVRPGWRDASWAKWAHPLEKWVQRRRGAKQQGANYDPAKNPGSSDGSIPPAGRVDRDSLRSVPPQRGMGPDSRAALEESHATSLLRDDDQPLPVRP